MLIRKPADVKPSEITSKDAYLNRRRFLTSSAFASGSTLVLVDEETRRLHRGSVCASRRDDVHALGCCDGEGLVTLHVYSPALPRIRTYQRALLAEDAA